MPRFLPDSNCLIAALIEGHLHAEASMREMDRRRIAGEGMVLAANSLSETYSHLTGAYRMSPTEAWRAIDENFVRAADELVALDAAAYKRVFQEAHRRGITGGRVYDALIAECA